MLKIEETYCPAPWSAIYHQLNNNSPCHTNRNLLQYTPLEYFNSDMRAELKRDFLNGKFPDSCNMCSHREQMGLKSTRKEIIHNYNKRGVDGHYLLNEEPGIGRLELRFSNLCNFKCRMCEPYSSSELAREMGVFNEPVINTSPEQIEELKSLTANLRILCLTGGEPFLIKQYYDFLDFLIAENRSKDIEVEIFTNCSVYNEKLIDKLLQFKKVNFVISVDGVGKVAEYIRHGTKWNTVRENMLRFAELPFQLYFNTAISQYTLFDVSNLAKFLIELYNVNNNIKTKCYAVITPVDLHFNNMPSHLRQIAIQQIDEAVGILKPENFYIFSKELLDIKRNLIYNKPVSPDKFINFTKKLDRLRQESFVDVFNIKLD